MARRVLRNKLRKTVLHFSGKISCKVLIMLSYLIHEKRNLQTRNGDLCKTVRQTRNRLPRNYEIFSYFCDLVTKFGYAVTQVLSA